MAFVNRASDPKMGLLWYWKHGNLTALPLGHKPI